MNKNIQTQFGRAAADYAVSQVHAQGGSLPLLLEMLLPQPHWRVLDVATGAGHTAHLVAPHVAQVIAADLTEPMLAQTRRSAAAKGLVNLQVTGGDAIALPFAAHSFDVMTCRLAAHHFAGMAAFLGEAKRLLKPGGLLALADTIVPGSRLRGRKAKLLRAAGEYVNAFEKLRDPSHGRNLSLHEWQNALDAAGFVIQHEEQLSMKLDFDDYADRMRVSPANKLRLRAMLLQAPLPVTEFLTPQVTGDRIAFHFTEAVFVAVSH
ncbi:MAG: methyltransferase domain-containing protein [Ardenticatenaceae bacterium]|nr:methyltransferase domain-containing protein [Anaerolineales bacterium]MCB8920154.1 methyltransferase domain-containing protein [Ardenticatenaceae bacterium]MCB9005051.1 methyltransferase domain-containing protein [Ardenticatenaceae bacterium]